MALKIVTPSEPIVTENLITTLFGQPGIGKSSLAFSAEEPLMLDFDGGAQRALGRKNTVRVTAWADVASISAEDVAPYKTIILDTVGRALEFLAADLIASNPKYARTSGELTMQGYGALKTAFAQWLSRIRTFGKHIVLIAHEKEEKDGDNTIVRLDAMGATRTEVVRLSDLVGFVSANGNARQLDFNPTDRHTGKNCAGFDALPIPHLAQQPLFLAGVLSEAMTRMNAETEAMRSRNEELAHWREVIEKIPDCDGINSATGEVPNDQVIKKMLMDRTAALGLVWDKTAKKFIVPEKESADGQQPVAA